MALDRLYQRLILEHNRAPLHFGSLANATHSAHGHDALCGDAIVVELRVRQGRIVEAMFSGDACAVTKASASLMTDWLPGRSVEDVAQAYADLKARLIDPELPDVEHLGPINELRAVADFPSRRRNAELPWRTALDALGG